METTMSSNDTDQEQSDYIPYEQQPYFVQSENVWAYGAPVIIILGTIGNLLSALVMMRKSLRSYTTSVYLVVLAVVDTAALYTGLLRYWIRVISDVDVRNLSRGSCKVHIFLVYFFLQFEAWILVSVAVERLFAIFAPLKSKLIFTKKFVAIQLSATGVVLASINAHFFWTFDKIQEKNRCTIAHEKYGPFMSKHWDWLDFCLASFVPFILMLAMNIAIISKLVYMKRLRSKNFNIKNDVKMTSMTAILLTVNFVFFLTTAPIALYLSTQRTWYAQAQTDEDFARLDLVWASVNIVAYLNNAINFVLYIISGPRFRRELLKMLHLDKLRVHPYPSENSATVTNMEMRTEVQNI